MNKVMTASKTGMVKKVVKNLTDKDLKQSTRELLDWLNDFVMVYDGMFCKVAAEIEKITACGDYMKLRMAEQAILEEAARRYVLPNDHGLKMVKKEG